MELSTDTVHVYIADLHADDAVQRTLRAVLHPTEMARHDRIRIERAARQFLIARGVLRHLLSRYLGRAPADVRLTHLAHGKPVLAADCNPNDLRFNLSHSHGLVIYGLTVGRDVGIDIELVRQEVRCDNLAQRFFSPREAKALTALPADQRSTAFFHCWTRKEAFVKAKGTGLTLPLADFDVGFAPGEAPALLRTAWDETEAARWRIYNLDVAPDYAAALALAGDAARIVTRTVDVKTIGD